MTVFILATLMLAMDSNGWIIYQLPYLLLFPKFNCFYPNGQPIPEDSPDYDTQCKPDYFCDSSNGISYTVDQDSRITLDNWMNKYDLICASPFVISSFSMSFFAGYAIGSVTLSSIPDKVGRKRIYFFA